jgi:hypothetical protein
MLRVSIIQRVTFAGVCRPSELVEEGGEVRCELWELLARELAGDEAADSAREYIFSKQDAHVGCRAAKEFEGQQTYNRRM